VDFEWDALKDSKNFTKHGIKFSKAIELWNDAGLIILPSKYPNESRYLAIGKLSSKHWTAIFAERGNVVRLISVRRSRETERIIYNENQ
jgi:hypothetical protein